MVANANRASRAIAFVARLVAEWVDSPNVAANTSGSHEVRPVDAYRASLCSTMVAEGPSTEHSTTSASSLSADAAVADRVEPRDHLERRSGEQ